MNKNIMVIVYMTRLGIRIPFYRWQWNLNNLSENEKIEFLKDLKHKDEKNTINLKIGKKSILKERIIKRLLKNLLLLRKQLMNYT